MDPALDAAVRKNPEVVYRELAEGGVLLHLGSGAYHGVNGTGAALWELLDEAVSVRELAKLLRARLDDPPEDLDRDVAAFVSELEVRSLVLPGR
jgi:Coenzyme PQQ synthesis protein D (PqqD)